MRWRALPLYVREGEVSGCCSPVPPGKQKNSAFPLPFPSLARAFVEQLLILRPLHGIYRCVALLLYGEVSKKFKTPASCFQLYDLTPHGGADHFFSMAYSHEHLPELRLFGSGELGCGVGRLL